MGVCLNEGGGGGDSVGETGEEFGNVVDARRRGCGGVVVWGCGG